jgi:hypothetical protein
MPPPSRSPCRPSGRAAVADPPSQNHNEAVHTDPLRDGINVALAGRVAGSVGHLEHVGGHVSLRGHLGLRYEQSVLPERSRAQLQSHALHTYRNRTH